MAPAVVPRCTYRVQLHEGFCFADAAGIADYLAALGVSHLYCSPYFRAASGSTHGYDVVDPQALNEELGGAPGHAEMVGALAASGLGQVLDIVPNHMAADPWNPWWWDVLENGPASPYAVFFDIDWHVQSPKDAYRVLVPVLGDHYGRVLEAGEVSLARSGGEFVLSYADHRLPVSPSTLGELLATAARHAGSPELARLAEGFDGLASAPTADGTALRERHDRKVELTTSLEGLCRADTAVADALDAEVARINNEVDELDALLRRQNYRLALWRTASEELDYRRFFNIESLVGIRVEDPAVFAETHKLILQLLRDGTLDGLRVDHVDGLRDPEGYLVALAESTGGVYTVVEKILEPGESLPPWPVSGTSGYDFLFRVNNLFVQTDHEHAMTDCYASATGETADYAEVVRDAKRQVMRDELAAEVGRLVGLLAELCDRHRRHRDHTRRELREALAELVAHFPVYRTYVRAGREPSEADRGAVTEAVRATLERRPELDPELVRFLGDLALGRTDGPVEAEFASRLAQLTAPVMAKGVEDTAFYRYHRLVSLNEVGGDPGVFGRPIEAFHRDSAAAAERWPETMLTLSTHDTKRSADVRARINVLSELPHAWRAAVARWMERTDRFRRDGLPDPNAQYLLFQTLVGAWPIETGRVSAFMSKATREAKVHTSWVDPVEAYDEALDAFIRAALADEAFVSDLCAFLSEHRIVARGRRNSLAQTALLLTCPGVPDLYQGTELFDLSLVDPDNRRPVDYDERRRLLALVAGEAPLACAPGDSALSKLTLVHRLLARRREAPGLFASTDYEPLSFHGGRADEVVGFRRGDLTVVVPRLGGDDWQDTTVELPAVPGWVDLVTGATGRDRRPALHELFSGFPVAVVVPEGT
jgi:(1->4)-alpha-D-glucan 1-alpha-D-glucosylmutase